VIGAGAAGCVIAGRLSQTMPDARIALIEAGAALAYVQPARRRGNLDLLSEAIAARIVVEAGRARPRGDLLPSERDMPHGQRSDGNRRSAAAGQRH
jgi:choline dehydrogenase-like flavoprotein